MNCKICNNNSSKILDIDFYKCDECGFIQKDDDLRVTFSEERVVYDRHNNSIEDKKYTDYLMDFYNRAVTPFEDSGNLLDFGSGPEPVLAELIARDTDFNVEHYDLHYQPEKVYEGKKYDVIVSTEVIEHFHNPTEMFTLFNKLLTDNGLLAVMTHFHRDDDMAFKKWWYIRDNTHISFYNKRVFECIAEKFGFKIIYSDDVKICTMRKISNI